MSSSDSQLYYGAVHSSHTFFGFLHVWPNRLKHLTTDPAVICSSPATDMYIMYCWLISPNKLNLRENARVILFYKVINNLAMVLHSCLEKADGRTRKKHSLNTLDLFKSKLAH